MRRLLIRTTTGLLVALAALASMLLSQAPAIIHADTDTPGVVYTLTNDPAGNQVAIYARAADGTLTPSGSVATGGIGTGTGLGSQGALVLSQDHRWLFAVNPGSNDVSVLSVSPNGLSLVDRAPSGGLHPISLTAHGGLLYVLNDGGDSSPGIISGFTVSPAGRLIPLAGSAQALAAGSGPAQVAFSPDGTRLVVTEKATNTIDVYPVDAEGRARPATAYASSGMTPFGFAFAGRDTLIVSEASGGADGQGAVSTYNLGRSGSLDVVTASAADYQTAPCWVVVAGNGRFAYTSNAGSDSISGYAIGADGRLTLLNADGHTGLTGAGSHPTDMALSHNGRFLYALDVFSHAISVFQVEADGSLTTLAGASGVSTTAVGLAAW